MTLFDSRFSDYTERDIGRIQAGRSASRQHTPGDARYYIGGSLASSAHGIARASLDADIVAALEPDHVDSLVNRLASAYYIPVDRLRSAVAARSSCNFIHLATMFKIDVFVSKGRLFDRAAAMAATDARASSANFGPRRSRNICPSTPVVREAVRILGGIRLARCSLVAWLQ